MPNQHLNGSTIENNQWSIAPEAAEQTTRLAEQTQLQVADASATSTLQTLETWATAAEKKNLLVSGDAEVADIEAAIGAAGQAPEVIFMIANACAKNQAPSRQIVYSSQSLG